MISLGIYKLHFCYCSYGFSALVLQLLISAYILPTMTANAEFPSLLSQWFASLMFLDVSESISDEIKS